MKRNTMLVLLSFCSILLFAQPPSADQIVRKCGTDYDLQLRQNPGMARKTQEIEAHTRSFAKKSRRSIDGEIITIPVVVHVVYSNNQENISDAQVLSQIEVMNEDFRRTNSDKDDVWAQAIDTEIEFCLATIDPNGNTTNGITRTSSTRTSWGTGDLIKKSASGGVDAWDTAQYLNMWVGNIGGGILGYAQFPGGSPETDGVVMGPQYFGSKEKGSGFYLSAPFDLGRTTTHEVGHFLNLRHIWGDGGCGVDDFVGDTPRAGGANYGCATGNQSCGSIDMVQNYMDYSDDSCMNLYTSGQKERMRSILLSGGVRANLANSTKCSGDTPPPPPPPTPECADAIKNYPYKQGFERGLGAWKQESDADDFEWKVQTGGTPSRETGPSAASEGDFYVYMESSRPNYPSKRAILTSPCFDLSELDNVFIDFKYHFYGAEAMGSVVLEASTDEGVTWSELWAESGNQGNSWKTAKVNAASLAGTTAILRFNGLTGTTWQGDTAIDDFGISNDNDGNPGTGCTDISLVFTFDNYPEDISYEIIDNAGEIIASGGPYNDEPDGSTLTLTGCFDNGCYSLVIKDSYGDGLCCRYGNGSYTLSTASGTLLAEGAQFSDEDKKEFCIGTATPNVVAGARDNGITTASKIIELYPNPVQGDSMLHVAGATKGTSYAVINVMGQVVLKSTLSSGGTIDVQNLSKGLYLVRFANAEGASTVMKSFIKK